ncbi:MAG: HIT domain-containing protein [Verrucomicrobia bacterium]|nr:HIT domain-containing protein [Verrucomicrobiota bacterium]
MQDFGPIERDRILAEDDLFIVARDNYPVSPGHSLVIVKRVVARFTGLTAEEKARLMTWIDWCISHFECTLKPKPDGFNVGWNDGPAAGQTIAQLHVHVIPRYLGDVPDPRGGVRWVLPAKARYWAAQAADSLGLSTGANPPTIPAPNL